MNTLTLSEASLFLNVSEAYIQKLINAGELEYLQRGEHIYISKESVALYKLVMKAKQRQVLSEMMQLDEEAGLYNTIKNNE